MRAFVVAWRDGSRAVRATSSARRGAADWSADLSRSSKGRTYAESTGRRETRAVPTTRSLSYDRKGEQAPLVVRQIKARRRVSVRVVADQLTNNLKKTPFTADRRGIFEAPLSYVSPETRQAPPQTPEAERSDSESRARTSAARACRAGTRRCRRRRAAPSLQARRPCTCEVYASFFREGLPRRRVAAAPRPRRG